MSIIRLNNQSISSVTALPSGVELCSNTPIFSARETGQQHLRFDARRS